LHFELREPTGAAPAAAKLASLTTDTILDAIGIALEDRADLIRSASHQQPIHLPLSEIGLIAVVTTSESDTGDIRFQVQSVDKDELTARLIATSYQDESGSILLVEEPYFQFAFAPVFENGNTVTGFNFRLRYDLLDRQADNYVKLRAEGDLAQSAAYFQRAQASASFGRNLALNRSKSWLLAAGADATYAGSALGSTGNPGVSATSGTAHKLIGEWRAGGNLQLYFPVVNFFSVSPGAGSRPIFNLHIAASGGNTPALNQTGFVFASDVTYTYRPQSRFMFDLLGTSAISNQARFGGRSTVEYVRFQGRFNLTSDFDYLAGYECGRQSPDYRKFCGWRTGITMVAGR
jgi:hypothetical protein